MARTMSNYNPYAAQGRGSMSNSRGARPQGARPDGGARQSKKSKNAPPVQKNKRREKDYFFIMRRGVCLIIMVLALLWIGVIAVNYLGILPQYTSFLVVPDLTPLDQREDVDTGEIDEDGNPITVVYEDQSVYISLTDPVFGALKKLVGLEMTDADGNSMSVFYDSFSAAISGNAVDGLDKDDATAEDGNDDEEVAEAAPEVANAAAEDADADEETDGAENADEEAGEGENDGAIKFGTVDPNTSIDPDAREGDSMGDIAGMIFDYAPVALILGAVVALIAFLLSFFSLFGRRIFKGFGLMSIIMLIAGAAMLLAGMVAMGNYMGNPSFDADNGVVSVLDFGNLTSFMLGVFEGAPASAPDAEIEATQITMVAGYGLIIEVAIPVVMLILSIFARKKVPYSIFDK